jgi:CubicO group peptidase (beta-lactamase class C family)
MHTAGLSTFNIGCDAERARDQCHMPTADEMIRDYGIVVSKPGARFDYSNLGFIVASEAVARAARRPLRALIREEVLLPLGMKHSSLGLDSAMAQEVVVPFVYGQGTRSAHADARGGVGLPQLQRMGECARPGAVRRLPYESAPNRPTRHSLRRRHRLDADRDRPDRVGRATLRTRLVDRGSLRFIAPSCRRAATRALRRGSDSFRRSALRPWFW